MTLDPRRAKSIFLAALGRGAAGRAPFLDEACAGDADLRRRIDRLLAAHDLPDSAPEAADLPTTMAGVEPQPGGVIDSYRLVEEIGEGGMGTVWMARQTAPVKRLVALKLVKAGMDSKQVLARFEAERQALALMDHPNIAKVLDAGATSPRREQGMEEPLARASGSGRPYFVMELVKGVPITHYCDEHRLTPRPRLGLFVPVCHAIQHAHQKGVIHRDIKPSNVLVAPYDGRPVPKVIDFGVAKAAGPRLTEETLVTGFGAIVGTLEYMSPEQAELNNLDVDTRSDVYSLGVLLYELLAGSTPFSRKELEGAGVLELLRLIREQEPTKPSTKLSTAEGLPTLAANRGMEPAKLTKLVRGELDWIVMKALEKDRSRRYESASAFAADVERYLRDEPVLACPPSVGYRLRKFVRRNKGAVVAASLVVLTLLGGIVGTTAGLFRAERARKAEAEQRQAADEERAIAREVNDFLQQDLLRQADSLEQADRGFRAEPNLTVKEALNRAAARIGDRFRDQPVVEAAIRQAIGEAYTGVGEYRLAAPHLERALALRKERLGADHPLTLGSMYRLGSTYLELLRSADALPLLEEAVKLRRARLGPDHRDTLQSQVEVAVCYEKLGRLPEAVSLHEETLQLAEASLGRDDLLTLRCKVTLALRYVYVHRFSDGVKLAEEALRLSNATRGLRHPGTILIRSTLGTCYEYAGRFPEAISLHQETLELMKEHLSPDHPQTLATVWALVRAYRGAGRPEKAVAPGKEALEVSQARYGPRARTTVNSMAHLGEAYVDLGRYDLAEPLFRQALAVVEKEWPDEPGTFNGKSTTGGALLALKKYAEAEPLLLEGYRGLKERAARIVPNAHAELTVALERLVRLYDAWGKPDQAAKWRKELEAHTKAAETTAKPKEK